MTHTIIEANHRDMAQAMKEMLQAQADFFAERKQGMPGDGKLAISRQKETAARDLFKQLDKAKPNHTTDPVFVAYVKFLAHCRQLLLAQYNYWHGQKTPEQLKICKRLEKDMRNRIKKYQEQQQPKQSTIF